MDVTQFVMAAMCATSGDIHPSEFLMLLSGNASQRRMTTSNAALCANNLYRQDSLTALDERHTDTEIIYSGIRKAPIDDATVPMLTCILVRGVMC